MKIGILSDSHDNLPKLEKAVDLFNKEKVALVLHAGDFIAPFSLMKLKLLSCEYLGVFGNNDGERKGLSEASGGRIKEGPLRIEFEKKKIIILHDIKQLDLKKEDFHLVVYGHTHKPEVIKENGRLILNPGECGGWLTYKSTISIIELNDLSSQIIEI